MVSKSDGREVLTLAEAAEELGLSYRSTHGWVQRGELRAERTGGTWLISRADLADFKERWSQNPHAQGGVISGRLGGRPPAAGKAK